MADEERDRRRAATVGSASEPYEEAAEQAAGAVLGANPFVGLTTGQLIAALGRVLGRLGLQPQVVARHAAHLTVQIARVVAGRSDFAPARSDKRWADPAWRENPAYRRWQQAYLAVCAEVDSAIAESGLDIKSEIRGRVAAEILTDALAPSNSPIAPAVVKKAFDTGGRSVVTGLRHAVSDLSRNRGMPRTVDQGPFVVGESIAATPGAVVLRTEVMEVIQYAPTTETVGDVPLVYIPPPINKYYVMDLAPGRSFVEYAVTQGITVYAVSWRNPTRREQHWDLSTYAGAVGEAVDAATRISRSESVHLLGVCAGGITSTAYASHLTQHGAASRIRSLTLLVTMFDTSAPSEITALVSRRSIAAARSKAQRQGVHRGSDMARTFAWMRPNDLVWNYYVNNWLLGQDPPAFDVLAWNADTTELPAALYSQYLDLYRDNLLVRPGGLTVLGSPVDVGKVDIDAYVLGGLTDHIVGWQTAYDTATLLGGAVDFVLCNSGHVQSLVCPVTNPKATMQIVDEPVGGADALSAEDWRARSRTVRGSWWPHWVDWVRRRSGERVPAPAQLGSDRYPVLGPAPGTYVKG